VPSVSVIIPVYKVEKYLERCLRSIIEQPFKDIELILVDDGSPDKCGDICDEFADKYDFVKVIHKENAGLGYSRNSGMCIASGEFITFVDSDDYIEGDLIGDLFRAANINQADTVIAAYTREQGEKRIIEGNLIAGKTYVGQEIINNVLKRMIGPKGNGGDILSMAAWRVLYSRRVIHENNLSYPSEREFISEDIIFNLHYYQHATKVSGIENAGYIYCLNQGSLTERYRSDRYQMAEILYREKKRILSELNVYDDEVQYRNEESFLRYSRYAIKSEVKFLAQDGWGKCKVK
jgi:glycosyltransferase involved in cell wall biosynthesis